MEQSLSESTSPMTRTVTRGAFQTRMATTTSISSSSPPNIKIVLNYPSDVEDLEKKYLLRRRSFSVPDTTNNNNNNDSDNEDDCCEQRKVPGERIGLCLAQRLFGPPRISLSWEQRCHLFPLLGQFEHLISLTIQGTTMGQVLSAEMVSTAIPSCLQVFTIDAGLIFDTVTSIATLQMAFLHHRCIQEIRLHNFLNHIRQGPLPGTTLLDPLVGEAGFATCPQLRVLELSCLASTLEWNVPLVSQAAIGKLLSSCRCLYRLEMTNLGLDDPAFDTIVTSMGLLENTHSTANQNKDNTISPPRLRELILNGNENTIVGLRRLVFACLSIRSPVRQLEAINPVTMTPDLYQYVLRYTERYHCPLQQFQVTFPPHANMMDPTLLRVQLRLHQLDLPRRFYSPQTATTLSCLQVLEEVSDDPNCLFRLLLEQPNLFAGAAPAVVGESSTNFSSSRKLIGHQHQSTDTNSTLGTSLSCSTCLYRRGNSFLSKDSHGASQESATTITTATRVMTTTTSPATTTTTPTTITAVARYYYHDPVATTPALATDNDAAAGHCSCSCPSPRGRYFGWRCRHLASSMSMGTMTTTTRRIALLVSMIILIFVGACFFSFSARKYQVVASVLVL